MIRKIFNNFTKLTFLTSKVHYSTNGLDAFYFGSAAESVGEFQQKMREFQGGKSAFPESK